MALSWTAKKQISFLLVFFAVAAAAGIIVFLKAAAPTCSDGSRNQKEQGVDCGGPCPNECLGMAKEPAVIWTRPLKVAGSKYDAVAIVDNRNLRLRADSVKYQFKLYDERNILIAAKEGKTFINPAQKFAIFETAIDAGSRSPARVFLEFEKNIKWEIQKGEAPSLVITDKQYDDSRGPSLSALITNKSLEDARGVEAAAILYDEDGNAIAASATRLEEIKGGESEEVFFTWPEDFEEETASQEILVRAANFSEF